MSTTEAARNATRYAAVRTAADGPLRTVSTPGVASGPSAVAAIGRFATWPLALAGLLCLLTGVLLGLGTKYGLVRYWWVAVKLVLNVVLVTLVLFLLMPSLGPLAGAARDSLTGGAPLPDLSGLAFPPVVSTTAVLVAMTLSVFKPWGRVFPARRRLRSAAR